MQDERNLANVINHVGPHGEYYHILVKDRLVQAVRGLKPNTPEYRNAFLAALKKLKQECEDVTSFIYTLLI